MEPMLILSNAGAVATTLLGLFGLVLPDKAAAFVSISPVGLNGRSEVRATYGGLFTALGVICITAQSEIVFMVAGVAWLGASVGRVYSMLLDRNYGIKNLGGIAVEAGIGALLVAPQWFV
ncbi:MAG: DUF4345 family protein [Gemmatimonadaceae bacterium]|jgi:hypothetical protein